MFFKKEKVKEEENDFLKLRKLKQLLDDKVITPEEFENKKKEILKRI